MKHQKRLKQRSLTAAHGGASDSCRYCGGRPSGFLIRIQGNCRVYAASMLVWSLTHSHCGLAPTWLTECKSFERAYCARPASDPACTPPAKRASRPRFACHGQQRLSPLFLRLDVSYASRRFDGSANQKPIRLLNLGRGPNAASSEKDSMDSREGAMVVSATYGTMVDPSAGSILGRVCTSHWHASAGSCRVRRGACRGACGC